MLVKALRLWHRDVKLTAEQVQAQTPLVGRLRYVASPYGGRDGRGAVQCLLMPQDRLSAEPLVQLYSARIRVIDERGLRIHGEEDEWRRKDRTAFKQVLWCWPVEGFTMEVIPPRGLVAVSSCS